jgi:hypothetical protein
MDAVYPDAERYFLSTPQRVCFAHDLTCVRPKEMSKPLVEQAIAIEGRDIKAMSGNCCILPSMGASSRVSV